MEKIISLLYTTFKHVLHSLFDTITLMCHVNLTPFLCLYTTCKFNEEKSDEIMQKKTGCQI
jgi:hypothetical protein